MIHLVHLERTCVYYCLVSTWLVQVISEPLDRTLETHMLPPGKSGPRESSTKYEKDQPNRRRSWLKLFKVVH